MRVEFEIDDSWLPLLQKYMTNEDGSPLPINELAKAVLLTSLTILGREDVHSLFSAVITTLPIPLKETSFDRAKKLWQKTPDDAKG